MSDAVVSTPTPIPQQALLAAIVESSFDGILSKTLDGVIVSWNPAAERIFGYTAAEIVGRSITLLIPAERLDEEASILERLGRGEAVANFETVRVRKDGTRIDVAITSSPVRDAGGTIVGASKIVRDITHAKATARALEHSEVRSRGIVDSAMDAIITVDDRGHVLMFNGAAARMFQCPADAALGGPLERFLPERFRADHLRWMVAFAQSGTTSRSMGRPGEIVALRGDGSEFPVEASISHIRIDGHALFTVIMRDVSELKHAQAMRRALEAQVREAQKMEAIGTLAGGIAHDFNNIIGSILGNAGLAKLDLELGHPASVCVDQIDHAATRARSVVRQILAFSRRQPQELIVQPMRPIIDEALELLRATLPTIVRIDTHLSDATLNVRLDATQMHQVLLNLCTNAWHALQGSTGRIDVGLESVALDGSAAWQTGELIAGDYVHVWVADNGCGMDAAVRERVFEPFFTTKLRGEGSGLGLAVVHGIVVAHHGAIQVESWPGKGSTFHVYLPISGQPAEVEATPDQPLAPAQGDGRQVAYIDDDEVMVLMVERLLRRHGFEPRCYRAAREALDRIQAAPNTCAIVVTDFNMPDCTGIEVATALGSFAPSLPVIITSGYISDELRANAQRVGVRALLEKENTFDELCGLIQRVLSPDSRPVPL